MQLIPDSSTRSPRCCWSFQVPPSPRFLLPASPLSFLGTPALVLLSGSGPHFPVEDEPGSPFSPLFSMATLLGRAAGTKAFLPAWAWLSG